MTPDPVRRAALALLAAAPLAFAGCENVPLSDIGPALSDDAPLSEAVRDALASDPETLNQRIFVRAASADTVRLSGSVDTDATRQRAEQVAQRVPGVRSVINTLQIR